MSDAESAKSIFLAAIERDPSGTCPTFLDGACEGDVALRARVERLLEAHRALGAMPGPEAGPSAFERAGSSVGPYRLLEEIGEGGMGVVYMAEQSRPVRRKVALKVIKPGMDSRQVIARFEAERQALAMMDHPNIARVLDAGATDSGRPYFVMELVRGVPITEYCDRERLPLHERLGLFVLVCRAVQHAHQKGIIHRDIKPSNVLITLHDGVPVPKMIDFGIAKATGPALTEKTLFTAYAELLGTPRYMSPEQAELSGLDVDTRSDIYSLGVLLYELLTGTTPFDGLRLRDAAFDEMRRILREEEPPTPSSRLGSLGQTLSDVSARRGSDPWRLDRVVRGELDWIAMKALEKDRRRRYETANDLAPDVTNYLTDRPVAACPPSAWYRLGKAARRNRVALMTAGLVALALVAGTLASAWQAVRASRAERRAVASLAIARRNERTSRQLLYGSQIQLAQRELAAGQVDFAQETLERLRPAPGEPDPRGFAWHYLRRIAHREVSLLFGHEVPVTALAMSPDGRTLASGDDQGTLALWDIPTWRERVRARGDGVVIGTLVYAPDGRTIVSGTRYEPRRLTLRDARTGGVLARLPGILGSPPGIAYSRDGRMLSSVDRGQAVDGSGSRIARWEIARGREGPVATERASLPGVYLAASPDLGWIATSANTGRVTVRDPSTGRALRTMTPEFVRIHGLASTPDGRSVVVIWGGGTTFFDPSTGVERASLAAGPGGVFPRGSNGWDFEGFPLLRGDQVWLAGEGSGFRPTTLERVSGGFHDFVVSPDRRTIAGAGGGLAPTLWDLDTGKKRAEFPQALRIPRGLAYTPDGKSLIAGGDDGAIRSWHIERPAEPRDRLAGHDKEAWALAYTPDGETLASASDDHTIKLWDPRSGALRATLAGHESLVSSLAVSPDGRTLASGSFDRTVRLWDLPSGRPRSVLTGHGDRVRDVAFSPDGRVLASSSTDRAIRLHDAAGGRLIRMMPDHPGGLHGLAFDREGTRLVSACNDGSLRIWDLADDRELPPIPGPKAALSVAFSHDGTLLASASDRGHVAIWDTTDWTRRAHFKGSDAAIRGLSFSPDGRTLAAAGDDAKVRLWDPATGQLMLLLEGHLRRVNSVAFSPNGRTLASASHDGAIRLWQSGP